MSVDVNPVLDALHTEVEKNLFGYYKEKGTNGKHTTYEIHEDCRVIVREVNRPNSRWSAQILYDTSIRIASMARIMTAEPFPDDRWIITEMRLQGRGTCCVLSAMRTDRDNLTIRGLFNERNQHEIEAVIKQLFSSLFLANGFHTY